MQIRLVYDTSQDTSIMATDLYMCRWSLRTDGLVANGAPFELQQLGMMAAEFTVGGTKLRHVELSLDVMSFMQQLRRSTGRDVFQVVPNTAFPLDLASDLMNPTYNIQDSTTASGAGSGNGGAYPSNGVPTYASIVLPSNTILNNNNIIMNYSDTANMTSTGTTYVTSTNMPRAGAAATSTTFSKEGAMENFLGTVEARAVVGAADPYLLLFTNQVPLLCTNLLYLLSSHHRFPQPLHRGFKLCSRHARCCSRTAPSRSFPASCAEATTAARPLARSPTTCRCVTVSAICRLFR